MKHNYLKSLVFLLATVLLSCDRDAEDVVPATGGVEEVAPATGDVAVNKAAPILNDDGDIGRIGGGWYGGAFPEVGITTPRYDPFPPFNPSEPPPPGYTAGAAT